MAEEKEVVRLNMNLDKEIDSEFADYARMCGRSKSDVIRELINKWNAQQRVLNERRAKHAKALLDGTYGQNMSWGDDNG